MQKVRVVTPTEATTASLAAFQDQLMNKDHWTGKLDYVVYAANNVNSQLPGLVQNALNDSPDVIVAAGSTAAGIIQYVTATIPIVQAVGGEIPANKKGNLTGFQSDAKAVAQTQLNNISAQNVTVLYDDTNDPSIDAFNALVAPGTKQIIPLTISKPNGFAPLKATYNFTDGFMVIPNAMYYKHFQDVVDMVDGNGNIKAFYYPEREFKNAHQKSDQNTIKVHGHKIPDTFRIAADLVSDILNRKYTVPNLPAFQEAVTDP
jgi:hypothetical protein